MIITIDGPTASGKSTTAQLLAQKLGFSYLNSGYLYRAFAYLLIKNKSYTLEKLYNPAESDIHTFLDLKRFVYTWDKQGNPVIMFDGVDITAQLKTGPEIDQGSSIVSTNRAVRQALLDVQREMGKKHDLVTDGRDTGSVVFPHAAYKFYLTAPLEIRASRWMHEQQARGITMNFNQACKELALRDERDITRTIAPLIVPEGAIIVDNGLYSIEETVNILYKKIQAK